jgi:ribosomal protein S18 acetylase RimI-like enzyme
MSAYFAELDARFDGGFDPAGALDDAGTAYNPPSGAFLVAELDGEVVGCGAVHLLDDDRAEVKRMWVSSAARGRGLGRRLLIALEQEAALMDRRTVVLDTHATLTEAISMYERHGYASVPPYNDNPYAQRWFSRVLRTDDARHSS